MKVSGNLETLVIFTLACFSATAQSASVLNQSSRLVRLATQSDVAGVRNLISARVNPNSVDNSFIRGWTALMAAAQNGNIEIAKVLIKARADVNATTQYGAAAVDVAGWTGHSEIASLLEASGSKRRATAGAQLCPAYGNEIGDIKWVTRNPHEVSGRINEFLSEPRVRALVPAMVCLIEVTSMLHPYMGIGGAFSAVGEKVTITLRMPDPPRLDDKKMSTSWSSDFPESIKAPSPLAPKADAPLVYVAAQVAGEDLLTEMLRLAVFTKDHIKELTKSRIPEIRIAAVSNITDKALLTDIANTDSDPTVRRAAAKILSLY